MKFQICGNEVYASTGGRDHADGQPFLIFLHGAGSSHVVWTQQSRSFAYNGYNVLAVDFPGHNLSAGEPLASVEDQAEWLIEVMDHLGIEKATLVGHSQGGLVALETVGRMPDRVEKIVFVATAAAIPVNDMLIKSAESTEGLAKAAMTAWGLGPEAHHHGNTVPGLSHAGMGLRIMDKNDAGVLRTDLIACNEYKNGEQLAAKTGCKTLCVFAGNDKMTPLKFGKKLADTLPDNTLHVLKDSGHYLPVEYPNELNEFMRDFLSA